MKNIIFLATLLATTLSYTLDLKKVKSIKLITNEVIKVSQFEDIVFSSDRAICIDYIITKNGLVIDSYDIKSISFKHTLAKPFIIKASGGDGTGS